VKLGADEVRHATKVVSYADGLGKTIEWQSLKRVASAASHIIAPWSGVVTPKVI
jgi:hypothetical protein